MMRADDPGPSYAAPPLGASGFAAPPMGGTGFAAPPPAPHMPPLDSSSFGPSGSGYEASGFNAPTPSAPDSSLPPALDKAQNMLLMAQQRYQLILDRSTPFPSQRWGFTAGALVVFMLRILISEGWYIVCYALFIYLLNLFLAFLTPKFDPSFDDDMDIDNIEAGEPAAETPPPASSSGGLMSGIFGPPQAEDEFRPFVRRLPEFSFWLSATKATLISLVCTFFSVFDIPVFWPILVFYFITLFVLTMRRQIQHMIKYKYVPFDMGRKATYAGAGRRV